MTGYLRPGCEIVRKSKGELELDDEIENTFVPLTRRHDRPGMTEAETAQTDRRHAEELCL